MKNFIYTSSFCFAFLSISFSSSCNSDDISSNLINNYVEDTNSENDENSDDDNGSSLKILSLGDSYTIGQSVCETCRFPEQLKDSLINNLENISINLQIIAQTGWTTTSLINAINSTNPSSDFDLVTLLIGVNNQYQGRPFSTYEQEFPELVSTAISKANNDLSKVIVISIPDYAYTPFGNGNQTISQEIDEYNDYAQDYCALNGISYIYITDITRDGLDNPNLVASDGLHPSE